jgi:hypothetical protein
MATENAQPGLGELARRQWGVIRSAAGLWEIRQSNSALIDVTVPTRAGRLRRKGIRIHRSGRLAPEEVTVRNRIPVTIVARTLLDLADVLDPQALRRAVTEAEYTNRFDRTSLARCASPTMPSMQKRSCSATLFRPA